MSISFWNIERLRVLFSFLVLLTAALTVSSILSAIQLMTPVRILMEQDTIIQQKRVQPVTTVLYKMFGADNQLQQVRVQDSTLKRRLLSQQQQPVENDSDDNNGLVFLEQLEESMQEESSLLYKVGETVWDKQWQLLLADADNEEEGLYFYPKGFALPVEMATVERMLRGYKPTTLGQQRRTQEAETTSVSTQVLPVIMVGVASAVIACAVMLYITDLRDRCRHDKFSDNEDKYNDEDVRHGRIHPCLTGTDDSHSDRWVDASGSRNLIVHPMLPPIPNHDDGDYAADEMELALACFPVEQISLSRVSTMTASVVDENIHEDRIVVYDPSQVMAVIDALETIDVPTAVTELSNANRVGNNIIDLAHLVLPNNHQDREQDTTTAPPSPVRSVVSRCSSMTNVSECSETMSRLQGEYVLQDYVGKPSKKIKYCRTSLDFSLDTTMDEERDAGMDYPNNDDDLADVRVDPEDDMQLEQLSLAPTTITDMMLEPPTTMPPVTDYIRDVYFVSTGQPVDLGLGVADASCCVTHPTVTSVEAGSPLVQRIFAGDFVLHVNETDATGLAAADLMQLMNATKMIQLTVMSAHEDGASDVNTDGGAGSVDLGLSDSAVEV